LLEVAPADIKDEEAYWYACEIVGGDLKIDNKEVVDARYFTKEHLKQIEMWPATKHFFNTYIFKERVL